MWLYESLVFLRKLFTNLLIRYLEEAYKNDNVLSPKLSTTLQFLCKQKVGYLGIMLSSYHSPYWHGRLLLRSLNHDFQGEIVSLLENSKPVGFTTERTIRQKTGNKNTPHLLTCHLKRATDRKKRGWGCAL